MSTSPPPSKKHKTSDKENDTSSSSKLFTLNWKNVQDCGPDPTPEPGVCTFMGQEECPEDEESAKQVAFDIMRKHGYRCESPPKDWKPQWGETVEDGEKDFQYLHLSYDTIKMMGKTTDDVEFELAFDFQWLYIRCNSPEAKEFVENHLRSTSLYKLGLIEHEEKCVEVEGSPGITLARRTGGDECSKVGTMFELRKGSKTIARALCSYKCSVMESAGPTIELFEVAKDFRREGYGKLLLRQMTKYFESIFIEGCSLPDCVKFNVYNCSGMEAQQFFKSQGFRNFDDCGEELWKNLDF